VRVATKPAVGSLQAAHVALRPGHFSLSQGHGLGTTLRCLATPQYRRIKTTGFERIACQTIAQNHFLFSQTKQK